VAHAVPDASLVWVAEAVFVDLVGIVSDQVDIVGIQDRTVRLLGMIIMVLHLAHLLLTSILTDPLLTMGPRLLLAHLLTMGHIATHPLAHLITTIMDHLLIGRIWALTSDPMSSRTFRLGLDRLTMP
jgi:hypothetical protein